MESLVVECLRCGSHRHAEHPPLRKVNPECPRCGYVGWAAVEDLTERDRAPCAAARSSGAASGSPERLFQHLAVERVDRAALTPGHRLRREHGIEDRLLRR